MVRKLASEPLVHFLIIGLALFFFDRVMLLSADNPKRIVVDQSTYASIAGVFEEARGRKPTRAELTPLVDAWISNEVLYREAQTMQLDRGDDMIRERILQKYRVMISGTLKVPDPTEKDLRKWFADHKSNYDKPAFYSFRFARVDSLEDAQRRAAALNAEDEAEEDAPMRVISFVARPEDNVAQLLGEDGLASLKTVPVGQWAALENDRGAALVMVDDIKPAREGTFEEALEDVTKRWRTWAAQNAGRERIIALKDGYDIVKTEPNPALFSNGDQEAGQDETSSQAQSR